MTCPRCCSENRPGASFCDSCGTALVHALAPDVAGLRERPGHLSEATELARRTRQRHLQIDAVTRRMFEHFELGNIDLWRIEMEEQEQRVACLHQPFEQYVIASSRAMHAIFEGRFDAAETWAQKALQLGRGMPGLDAEGVHDMQIFSIRCEQGRLRELAPLVRNFMQVTPRQEVWRPGLALIYAEIGQPDAARGELEALARDGLQRIAQDGTWVASMTCLAQVAARLDDAPRCEQIYALLLPYEGRNLLAGTTVACFGAASSILGMLATVAARYADAQRHFDEALAMNARQGAKPAVLRTQYRLALMFLKRRGPGDADAARPLLLRVAAEAKALGMQSLLEDAGNCLDRLPDASRTAPFPSGAAAAPAPPHPAGLSAREVQVLQLVATGKGNREIATRLFISPNTVANHVRKILTKTGSANRTEAASFAIRRNI